MKWNYAQPAVMTVKTETAMMICGSQDITSNNDINYGGVDEEGTKDPASRRYDIWDEEEWDEEEIE